MREVRQEPRLRRSTRPARPRLEPARHEDDFTQRAIEDDIAAPDVPPAPRRALFRPLIRRAVAAAAAMAEQRPAPRDPAPSVAASRHARRYAPEAPPEPPVDTFVGRTERTREPETTARAETAREPAASEAPETPPAPRAARPRRAERGKHEAAPSRKGPGPSKLKYRLERTWAKPAVRAVATVYIPLVCLGFLGWGLVSDDRLRGETQARIAAAWDALAERPEFALEGVEITGGSEALRARALAAIDLGQSRSSLKMDVATVRERIEALDGVRSATVHLDPQGMLLIRLDAREAVALYRDAGGLALIDAEGVHIGAVPRRAAYPRLPLVLGERAEGAVHEVLSLMDGAPDLVPRIRAFVRVGARRWDVVLADDRIIKLPEEAPGLALARVMALHYGGELLDRDVAVIDMRVPERPTLRLTHDAIEAFRLRQAVAAEDGKDT